MHQDRLKREIRTARFMIEIYCHGNHHSKKDLCAQCQSLFSYVMKRIEKCPLLADKPTCAKCQIHCYNSKMREQVRRIMRYSGPRMMIYHPLLAILHYLDQAVRHQRKK